jgi:hypothetical protein
MAFIKILGRVAALLAAALLVTWGLYSFIDSDFAAGLPANRREIAESEESFFGTESTEHDEADYEDHAAAEGSNGFVRPDGSIRPGRGEGGRHIGNAVDLTAATELVEPLLKVIVIVVLFAVFGRLFGRRKARTAPPRTPSSPPAGA